MKKSNLKRKRYQSARLGSMLAAALLGTQITDYGRYRVLAEDQQWEGVTSLSTDSEWLAFDSLEAELVVEEVYTEEESSLTKGDAVLKLTQESYEDAVRYYTAALLRAQNELTDAELEHEKGMLEAEYTVELARVQAELAESKREQFQKELEDTIEEHEEVAAELEEKIAELESGIADGSYDTSDSSGASSGTSSGGSSSGGGSGNKAFGSDETEKESESEEPQSETEMTGETQPNQEESEKPEETEQQKTEEQKKLEEQIKELEIQEQQLLSQAEEKNQEFTEILTEIYSLAGAGESEGTEDTAAGNEAADGNESADENETTDREEDVSQDTQNSEKLETARSSKASAESFAAQAAEQSQTASALYEDAWNAYAKVLEKVKQVLENIGLDEYAGYADDAQKKAEEISDAYTQANETYRQAAEAYASSVQSYEEAYQELQNQTGAGDEGSGTVLASMTELLQRLKVTETEKAQLQTDLETVQDSLETAQDQLKKMQTDGDNTQGTDTDTPGNPDSSDSTANTPPQAGEMQEGEKTEQMSAGTMPGAETSGSGGGMSSDSASAPSVDTSAEIQQGSQTGAMGQQASTEEETLFGDEYDLTQIKSQIDKEPAGTDEAEELAEELGKAQETVAEQYAELLRNQKKTELEIQYTCDTEILEGSLAEFTYQETIEELDESYQEAEENVAGLQEICDALGAMENGVITAGQDGMVASFSYEEGDTLDPGAEIISYYDTSTVQVPIEVSQYDIQKFSVGDSVTVTISGYGSMEGTVSEKACEIVEDTSRTDVEYEVVVTLSGIEGGLSAGLSAEIELSENME